MKTTLKHISIIAVLAVTVLSSCSQEEHELIPRKKLAMIYAEMLVTDQWIADNPDVRSLTDTSLIYEPILEKYGFTSEDYRHSVNYYLDDPERFSRIFRTTSEILDERYHKLKKQKELQDAESEKIRRMERYAVDFRMEDHFPYMSDEPYVKYYDSLAVEYDTLANALMIHSVEVKDTIYDRLEMIILSDTLSVADSLQVADTLALQDTSDFKPLKLIKETDLPEKVGKINMNRRPKEIKDMDQMPAKQFGNRKIENRLKETK